MSENRKEFSFTFAELREHVGHDLECVVYGDDIDVAIECVTCSTVILDIEDDGADKA